MQPEKKQFAKQFKKPNKQAVGTLAVDILFDIAGGVLFALGYYTFAKNGGFAPGGISGLALIGNHLWGLPIGTLTLVLNVPIVLLSYKVVGHAFLFKSFRTMLISTFFLDIVFPRLPVYQGNQLLAAIFTGVLSGAGLALIYMRGSSTGGTDFLVLSVKKLRPHLSLGQVTLMSDGVVILLGGLVFGHVDAVLYGMIATFSASIVIDKIMYGADGGKLAIIITGNGKGTAQRINEVTGRGSTLVPAVGTYSGQQRDMLLCACGKAQVFKVRNVAHEVDPGAFVMVTEASEVFGEGFKRHE